MKQRNESTNPGPIVVQASSATPNPNRFGLEQWYFTLDLGSATTVEYAVSYTVAGVTYWDNNFTRNYRTTVTRLP